MNASFHTGNRKRLYEAMRPASLLVMFSGEDVRKTNDEYYPFYTDRNFYYLTGLDQHELVLMAVKEPSGNVHEQIYILPPDLMAERWTGARLKPAEVEALSGISDVRFVNQFQTDFHALAAGGHYSLTSGQIAQVYLDLFRVSPQDIDRPAQRLLKLLRDTAPRNDITHAGIPHIHDTGSLTILIRQNQVHQKHIRKRCPLILCLLPPALRPKLIQRLIQVIFWQRGLVQQDMQFLLHRSAVILTVRREFHVCMDEVRLSQAPAFPFNKSGVFQLTKELRCLVIGTAKCIHNLLYGKNDIHSPLPV